MFVKDKLHTEKIPEIWTREEEKSLAIGQLKYHYLQIARQKFQGKVFINNDKKSRIRET